MTTEGNSRPPACLIEKRAGRFIRANASRGYYRSIYTKGRLVDHVHWGTGAKLRYRVTRLRFEWYGAALGCPWLEPIVELEPLARPPEGRVHSAIRLDKNLTLPGGPDNLLRRWCVSLPSVTQRASQCTRGRPVEAR